MRMLVWRSYFLLRSSRSLCCRGYAQAAAVEETDVAESNAPQESNAEQQLQVLKAVPREASGKIPVKKDRRAGFVPGIVISREDGHLGGHKQLLSLPEKPMELMIKKMGACFFKSRLYTLELYRDLEGGELLSRERVLPRLVHIHAVSDKLLNLTFIRAPPSSRFKVEIPLVFRGEDACSGLKRGGRLNTIRRTVKYVAPSDVLPPYLEVDLSNLEVGQKVLIKDLKVPQGLIPYKVSPDWPVCKIMGTRSTGR